MKPSAIQRLIALVKGGTITNDYHDKDEFLRLARSLAKKVATDIGLPPGTFDVRVNRAGSAVSGEAVLHADHIYVVFDAALGRERFMYRGCRSRGDYVGFVNQWFEWAHVETRYDKLIERLREELRAAAALSDYCRRLDAVAA